MHCRNDAAKFGQYLNLLLSLGISFLFLKIADKVRPGNRYFKFSTLFLFSLITVYYKTFSQVRGEPYTAFFTVAVLYVVLDLLSRRDRPIWKDTLVLGLVLGLLILTRQWGFFAFPALCVLAVMIFLKDRVAGWRFSRVILGSFVVAFLVGSWFYWNLYLTSGSFDAFNRDPIPFSFSNQPPSFYRNMALDHFLLFRSPVRKSFDNQFFPVFYSDTWGDYWGYFVLIPSKTGDIPANIDQITPYLGRVNLVSLLPSFILLCGLILGVVYGLRFLRAQAGTDENSLFLSFLSVFILISVAGFLYFLIKYPIIPKGVNIKATYMIQIFVAIPFLGAEFLEWIRSKSPNMYLVLVSANVIVFLHNLSAMITHY